jgi:hypothetical protein
MKQQYQFFTGKRRRVNNEGVKGFIPHVEQCLVIDGTCVKTVTTPFCAINEKLFTLDRNKAYRTALKQRKTLQANHDFLN